MAEVLIDASNLFHGGAVQVAASFVQDVVQRQSELHDHYPWLKNTSIFASSRVALQATEGNGVVVTDSPPLRAALASRPRKLYDVSFTVFGPQYRRGLAKRSIVGFADVTSLYPEVLEQLSLVGWKGRARRHVSRRLTVKADRTVVETTAIQRDLVERWGMDPATISVIPNALSAQFTTAIEEAVRLLQARPQPEPDQFELLYVTRPYPHKNLSFIGQFGAALHSLNIRINVQLTITQAEYNALDPITQRYVTPIGPLKLEELAGAYANADGVLFPSLLEAFSAAPLEAMALGLPLVASDRPFVRTVCGHYPIYIDPLDPKAAASTFARAIEAGKMAKNDPELYTWTSADRTRSYLEAIDAEVRYLQKTNGCD